MKVLSAVSLLLTLNLYAQDMESKLPSQAVLDAANNSNLLQSSYDSIQDKSDERQLALRPFAEYENPKYLIFSAKTDWGTADIKQEMLANMPDDIDVIIYTERQNTVENLKMFFTPHIGNPDRLKFLVTNEYGNPFWSRDTVPIPVWTGTEANKELAVVDAKYYHEYEADRVFADYFSVPLIEHNYYFEGGNFISDSLGNCLLVNRNTGASIPAETLKTSYGCKTVTKLPFVAGIGHVDERVKLISDKIALTDTESYRPILEKLGFKVVMVPRPVTYMGTYINSLVLNKTVFLPVFGEETDAVAVKIYEDHGFQVVSIRADALVRGMGSIHCITMAYPSAPNVVIKE